MILVVAASSEPRARALVVVIGTLRGGPVAWRSLRDHVVDSLSGPRGDVKVALLVGGARDDQLARFREDGYVARVPLLDRAGVAALSAEIDALTTAHANDSRWHEFHANEGTDDARLCHGLGHWRIGALSHDLVFHPTVAAIAAQLLPGGAGPRLFHDQAFIKPSARGGPSNCWPLRASATPWTVGAPGEPPYRLGERQTTSSADHASTYVHRVALLASGGGTVVPSDALLATHPTSPIDAWKRHFGASGASYAAWASVVLATRARWRPRSVTVVPPAATPPSGHTDSRTGGG